MKNFYKILAVVIVIILLLGAFFVKDTGILEGRMFLKPNTSTLQQKEITKSKLVLPAYNQVLKYKSVLPAYNESRCYDSDFGKEYTKKGTIYGKERKSDYCDGGDLIEFYCEENRIKEETITTGVKKECINGKLSNTTHEPVQEFNVNEVDLATVTLTEGNISITGPVGYELYLNKMLEDLGYCQNLVPEFLGINYQYWDGINAKIYVSDDGSYKGYAVPNNGQILCAKGEQSALDDSLEELLTNNPDGFLYSSSSTYCSNSHEYTHHLLSVTPIPGWANEGMAEYSQKFNQSGSKDLFECQDESWYGKDYWVDDQYKNFDYADLSESKNSPNHAGGSAGWYHSVMCFWEQFDEELGEEDRREIFEKLSAYDFENMPEWRLLSDEELNDIFINQIFLETIEDKEAGKDLLENFGLVQNEDY